MSSTLYNEAIEAAEQIKLSAEEKVKQQIIESISPQIKSLVEKKLFEEKNPKDENNSEVLNKINNEEVYESKNEEVYESKNDLVLNNETREILTKLINNNAKKDASIKKINDLNESLKSIQRAITLAENSNNYEENKYRIFTLYQNLVSEISNLSKNSIIKSNKEILKEYYKLNKELENMSKRHSNRKYLNESLEDLLEMDLFEIDEEIKEDDADEMMSDPEEDADSEDADSEKDADPEDADPEDADPEETDDINLSPEDLADLTVRDLATAAGLVDEGDDLSLEGLLETDSTENKDGKEPHADADDSDAADPSETVFEIDENMLRNEIGKMKALRESEAKDMASHFGGGTSESEAFVDGVELNKLHEIKTKAAKVVRKNRMLESKLSQYKKALVGMKSQLSEMNLFNAKLLYANKLMQNRDLTMKQQRHIVESLDDAKTLGEAKILFESLSKTSVSGTTKRNSNLSESASRRQSGSSSNPVRSAQSKPINESVALNRWATLAGIKN